MSDAFDGSEIAIVGMAGRFPGARNTNEFWRNLRDGIESITFFTDEQLAASGVEPTVFGDKDYVKAAGLIDDFDCFDAGLFAISAREAELMDPQHRILLEVAWEALENAGYDPGEHQGTIGVYAGATINTYLPLNILSNPDILSSLEDVQINLSNGVDFLTTRISYKLNLRGPSHVVQSACSSSLVAVHTACQSLLNEECDMALAGGVSVNVKLRNGYRYVEGGMASPDGHCRAFDASARGTIFSSGAGLLVLKPLSAALANCDYIHAIIKGSAINNDGSLKVGYTAPSVEGQANVIVEALASAGVAPDTISYVEAHGTGTPIGDPVEIRALTKAFRTGTDKARQCALGSVKTNIGHLDAAAGVAGLIKTALSIEHGMIPPSLHFQTPNPETDLDRTPFFVNTKLREWKPANGPRRAGVSAFGVGGTNAHVILEEAPAKTKVEPGRKWQLLTLSAATEQALEQARLRLIEYLRNNQTETQADVAYTLHVGRKPLNRRLAVITNETARSAAQDLDQLRSQSAFEGVLQGNERKIVFMFPGQGAQYVNMGLELYNSEPVFKEEVDRCSELLNSTIGVDLRTILYPKENVEAAATRLNETRLTQPALFVIEYALAKLWISAGVVPWAMIGHSVGEYAAACTAQVLSLEAGLDLITERARLMSILPEGEMIAVPLSEGDLEPFLADGLSVAAVNAPSQCVISGATRSMTDFKNRLGREKIAWRPLNTSRAFHSQMMEPIIEPFVNQFGRFELNPPKIRYISNVTGTWITGQEATSPRNWASQLREPVRFADGLGELFKTPDLALLEVGPGDSLMKLANRQSGKPPDLVRAASLTASDCDQSGPPSFIHAIGILWSSGARIDWKAYHRHEKRRRVPLPTYPFERQRYWIAPNKGPQDYAAVRPSLPLHPKPELKSQYVSPKLAAERVIANIWEKALGVDKIGLDDNFFDLGGDSLTAIQVASRLKQELAISVPVVSVYEGLTIRSLVKLLGLDGSQARSAGDAHNNGSRDARVLKRREFQQKAREKKSEVK